MEEDDFKGTPADPKNFPEDWQVDIQMLCGKCGSDTFKVFSGCYRLATRCAKCDNMATAYDG